jgi:hypothetical protein
VLGTRSPQRPARQHLCRRLVAPSGCPMLLQPVLKPEQARLSVCQLAANILPHPARPTSSVSPLAWPQSHVGFSAIYAFLAP